MQLASSALIFFSVRLAGVALFAFTIATILVIHNPFVNELNDHSEYVNVVTNMAIAGIALFIASYINPIKTVIIQSVAQDGAKKFTKQK